MSFPAAEYYLRSHPERTACSGGRAPGPRLVWKPARRRRRAHPTEGTA
ncbi:MAG TPA: hypothetical protein VFL69_00210 [Marmoricola sp.]|nr:hypothetical protein [Marmoricola sp.]